MTIKTARIQWDKCWRLIPSRFPTINVFERVANQEDFEALYALEGLTNDRLRQEVGELSLVPPQDRVYGPGSSYIMSAFTHLNPLGSRFSDGTWGVYYAAETLETAMAETVYHQESFLRATDLPPLRIDMRVLVCGVSGDLHDLRNKIYEQQGHYDKASYDAPRRLARSLKDEDSQGIVYWSVRAPQAQNVAIFKPKILSQCRQERHLEYVWDGEKIAHIFEKKALF
ncbi:MAG: RES family NAD+ phosphorylase [Alphaproteobacteria bacterium]|nr:RES family NAD+ phosphorylase [Alphaproteobacteria bacterium]